MRKLTKPEVERLREGWEAGLTAEDLAAEHGVTARHVRRLMNADAEESPAAGMPLADGAEAALAEFLSTLDLDEPAARVLAATAAVVARKLDRADARSAAGLAARLQDLVSDLERHRSEPDEIEALRLRRAQRRANAA